MEWLKTFERVKEIDKQLVWPSVVEAATTKAFIPDSLRNMLANTPKANREVLADQVREVLYEGQLILTERDTTTNIHAFLFTDILLLSKAKKDPKKSRVNRSSNPDKRNECFYNVIGQPLPTEHLSVYDVTEAEASLGNMCNAFVVVQRNRFQQIISILTFQSHTSLGKENWMSWIRQANAHHSSHIGSEPRRQESFKQLLDLDEKSPTNLLKMSRVLEIGNGSPVKSRIASKLSQLRKLNSDVELWSLPKGENRHKFDCASKADSSPSPTVHSRTRALSVDSYGYEDKKYCAVESRPKITIEANTTLSEEENSENSDKSEDNDVVFEL